MVTVTFNKQEEGTLMTLVHSDLPNTDGARGHEDGWNYFLKIFSLSSLEEAHVKSTRKTQLRQILRYGRQATNRTSKSRRTESCRLCVGSRALQREKPTIRQSSYKR
jgi:hypothetical protein